MLMINIAWDKQNMALINTLIDNEDGATDVEYGLIASVAIIQVLGTQAQIRSAPSKPSQVA